MSEQKYDENRVIEDVARSARESNPMDSLIMARVGQGDIENLSREELNRLVNPDGNLSDREIEVRLQNYRDQRAEGQQQRNRPVQKNLGVVGLDPRTGESRLTSPGETINERGQIITVDPRMAAEMAERMKNAEPRDVRQRARRGEAFASLATSLLNRASVGSGVVYLSFDEERRLTAEYDEAKQKGYRDDQLDFLPLRAYMNKIAGVRPDGTVGRPVRQLLNNECGVFQMSQNPGSALRGKIACLRDRHITPENNIQVGANPAAVPKQESLEAKLPPPPPGLIT